MLMFASTDKLALSAGSLIETAGGLLTPGALKAAACKVTFPALSKIRSTRYLMSNTCPGVSAATSNV